MNQLIENQKKIFPDLLDIMQKRHTILYTISLYEPIGRRGIVEQTNYAERFIRNEIKLLEQFKLIETTTRGVLITELGKEVMNNLLPFTNELSGTTKLEEKLKDQFNIQKIIIVPGNCDENEAIKKALGEATVQYLKNIVHSDVTIAVTGGTTMAAVADAMVPFDKHHCLFVPARGGLGEKVENQANTIVAKMAKAEKGNYHLLHVPDPLSEELYQSLINEPSITETLEIIKSANIVIHGIGDALTMAKRRKTNKETKEKLKNQNAVSEAFGYYFNENGAIVHKVRTFGIQLEDLNNFNDVITVAGGSSKAQAIISYLRQDKSNVLVTDEAAADEILKILNRGGITNDS